MPAPRRPPKATLPDPELNHDTVVNIPSFCNFVNTPSGEPRSPLFSPGVNVVHARLRKVSKEPAPNPALWFWYVDGRENVALPAGGKLVDWVKELASWTLEIDK